MKMEYRKCTCSKEKAEVLEDLGNYCLLCRGRADEELSPEQIKDLKEYLRQKNEIL